MTDVDIKSHLVDRSAMALTMWGESRGSTVDVRIAVGNVIRNRARFPMRYQATENSFAGVCLAPRQFSCWNGGDVNGAAVMAQAERIVLGLPILDVVLKECLYLSDGIVDRVLLDNTRGATFYLEYELFKTDPPSWAGKLKRLPDIGPFVMLREADQKATT